MEKTVQDMMEWRMLRERKGCITLWKVKAR